MNTQATMPRKTKVNNKRDAKKKSIIEQTAGIFNSSKSKITAERLRDEASNAFAITAMKRA